ncbi:hypothetical protein [Rivularia sp. UHCC 0363]|uniref:hypothetical protein n=1 Tax=Rivularia sp. UHCC 0363 TaxID=3110244 RepID=UPI002B21834A|nr:hypothetical protein [Rivularia sp. UHCC 0363]MEA5599129.1 hypothetical protein [Rivularia sp. UHCC 0363]
MSRGICRCLAERGLFGLSGFSRRTGEALGQRTSLAPCQVRAKTVLSMEREVIGLAPLCFVSYYICSIHTTVCQGRTTSFFERGAGNVADSRSIARSQ